MKTIRMIFGFWLILGTSLLLADILSYYKILYNDDWFQIISRKTNVPVVYLFITLPYFIATFYVSKYVNKLNSK